MGIAYYIIEPCKYEKSFRTIKLLMLGISDNNSLARTDRQEFKQKICFREKKNKTIKSFRSSRCFLDVLLTERVTSVSLVKSSFFIRYFWMKETGTLPSLWQTENTLYHFLVQLDFYILRSSNSIDRWIEGQ